MIKRVAVLAAAVGSLLAFPSVAFADSGAWGSATNSPGVLSGNVIQVPVHIPVNVCGNSVNVIGLLNPAAGNVCTNS